MDEEICNMHIISDKGLITRINKELNKPILKKQLDKKTKEMKAFHKRQ